MENYNEIPKTGTIGGMVDNVNANFQLTKEMLERLEVTKDHAVGLFSTLASLQTAYPTPEVGDWALVGDTTPFAIYKCSTAGTWSNTGGTYDGGSIDLSDYVKQEEFDELDAVVNGGSSETPATTTWKESGTMINYATGDEFTIDSQYYAASDFIQIPNGTSSIRLLALVIKPGGLFNPKCGIAFYNASQNYVSGIAREEYDHGGTYVAGMAERTYPVPNGARYMRTTCMTSKEGNWFCYFISSTGSGLVGRMNDAELNIDATAELAQDANDLAQEAYDLASQEDEPTHDVYKREGEEELSAIQTSSNRGVAVYTTLFSEDKAFNTVIVRGVKASAACTAEWRVYAYPNTSTNVADYQPPSGNIGSNHVLLASGTSSIGTVAKDLTIKPQKKATCPAGSQVIVYLVSETATLSLGKPAVSVEDTHLTYTCNNENTWTTWWSRGGTSYKVCAPILRYESAIMSREEVEEMIDEALEDIDIKTPDWKIILPNTIHVLVGGEINLWDDGISLPLDNGLKSPLNYSVQWTASMNNVMRRHPRGVCIRPTQAGAFTLTCRMYTNDGESLIDEKAIKIVAVEKNALSTAKNIVCIGSSSCPGTTQYIDEILSDSSRYTGTKPTFWGTQTTQGVKHEGHGGWKWSQFWGSASPGSVTNPLYDSSVGHASASYYRNTLGMGSAKFDLVFFQLGLNDFVQLIGSTPKTVAEYRSAYTMQSSVLPAMKSLVEEFMADNPDCKIILALPYICNNSGGHSTTATYASLEFAKASYAMRLEYLSFLETHPSVILSAGHQMIDRWYGFVMDSYMTSASSYRAYQQTDIRPHDIIHCGVVGYRQYAEGFVASIIAALGTTSETETSCGYDTGDVIASNVNPASPSVSAVDQTARDAAAAAQSTANTAKTTADNALTRKNGVTFDVYNTDTTTPTDSGSTSSATGTMYYFKATNTFMLKVGSLYYSTFAMYPNAADYAVTLGVTYWCGNKAYTVQGDGKLAEGLNWVGTQAQYDALTTAQKETITAYIIEDNE